MASSSCAADEVRDLLDPLPIRKLFGLGAKTAPKVEALGIHTLGDLRQAAPSRLRPIFGRYTERLQQRAAGIDDRPVVPDEDEKQISAEETFDADISEPARAARGDQRAWPTRRARGCVRGSFAGGCVTVKIRRGDFTTYTRQRAFEPRTQETRVVARIAGELLDAFLVSQPRAALRLLGVGVSDLGEEVQADLFADPGSTRNRQLDSAVDAIRQKFGVRRAAPPPAQYQETASSATPAPLPGARVVAGTTPPSGAPWQA